MSGDLRSAEEMEAAEALAGMASAPRGSEGGGYLGKPRIEVGCSRSCPDLRRLRLEMNGSNAGKQYAEMDEAEKEAKRIRRVMANRESARRTIRRRQVLCEDLTRRAIELTEENQRLKKGKELALKEYESLETANKLLKAKLVKEIKPDLQIASTMLKPTSLDASASSANFPILPYGHPPGQIFWPSIINSSVHEHCQEGWSSSSIKTPGLCRSDLAREQEKLFNTAGHGSSVYIVPYPWFISLNNSGNECSGWTCGNRRNLNEVSLGNRTYGSCSSSSRMDSWTENRTFDLSVEVKAEPRYPLIHDLIEGPVESSPFSSNPSSSLPSLARSSLELGSSAEGENGNSLNRDLPISEALPFGSSSQDDVRPAGVVYPNQNLGKDAITTAKARRKRRREIARLKSGVSRQCRA